MKIAREDPRVPNALQASVAAEIALYSLLFSLPFRGKNAAARLATYKRTPQIDRPRRECVLYIRIRTRVVASASESECGGRGGGEVMKNDRL